MQNLGLVISETKNGWSQTLQTTVNREGIPDGEGSLGTSLWTSQQVKIRTGVKMVKVTL